MDLEKFDGFRLASEFYRVCEQVKLPRHLKDQLSRASSSVALNLCEGLGKNSVADRRRFFAIAHGSFLESKAILHLAGANCPVPFELLDRLGAILYRLVYPRTSR